MNADRPTIISVLDPLTPAFERVKTVLFRPFDLVGGSLSASAPGWHTWEVVVAAEADQDGNLVPEMLGRVSTRQKNSSWIIFIGSSL